jgi:hypothetical protein
VFKGQASPTEMNAVARLQSHLVKPAAFLAQTVLGAQVDDANATWHRFDARVSA